MSEPHPQDKQPARPRPVWGMMIFGSNDSAILGEDETVQDDEQRAERLRKPSWVTLIALLFVLPLFAGILGGIAATVAFLSTLTSEGAMFAAFAVPFAIAIAFVFGGALMAIAWLIVHVFSARKTRRFAQALAIIGGAFGLFFGFSILGMVEDGVGAPLIIMPVSGAAIGWYSGNILGSSYE